MDTLALIGYASGIAANNSGCKDGPLKLYSSLKIANTSWHSMVKQEGPKAEQLRIVTQLCSRLAVITRQLTLQHQPFAVIGGDHSSAIGTWSGVSTALAPNRLGLIWIDAHLDSHTVATTPSGNIHGMPLASLLGHGAESLTGLLSTQPKLRPEDICIIGTRSYESAEYQLLKSLNVKIFFMEEVKQRGLKTIILEALNIVTANTHGFGFSIDLDAIDPQDAPAVSYPEQDGLNGEELCQALQHVTQFSKPLGIEIVEFNPHQDQNNKTEQLIARLLSIFCK